MVNVEKMSDKRVKNLIIDLEEWMCLVGEEEDWLLSEDEEIEDVYNSNRDYLEELIDWVSEHVCSDDKHNPEWWESHGFNKSESRWLAE